MKLLVRALLICILVAGISEYSRAEIAAKTTSQKAVLITGASTGIGRKATELLAAKGFWFTRVLESPKTSIL